LIAAAEDDPSRALVGEVKLRASPHEHARLLAELGRKAASCPALSGRRIELTLWLLTPVPGRSQSLITAARVVRALT